MGKSFMTNKGNQIIEPCAKQKKGKQPKVKTGNDLRSK